MSDVCNLDAGCCPCADAAIPQGDGTDSPTTTLRILSVGGSGFRLIKQMVDNEARAFESYMNGRVKIIVEEVDTLGAMADEIRSNAALETGYFEGFVSNPGVVGTAVQLGAFMDLGTFVQESLDLDWLDILPAFREVITTYDGKVYMLPLDGDVHSLFYRMDVLEHFGLEVPRTWDEYVDVAKAVHGKEYNGTKLVGSCIGRVKKCVGAYYANLVLAPYTQTGGTKSGHLFDPRDMKPLAGEALAEAIRQLEEQAEYGADAEFEECGGGGDHANNIKHHIVEGDCALTYNWGDNYKAHMSSDSKVGGLVGVALTPGSTRVLDRETGKLVPCNAELCKFGEKYEDIGWVNRAPYAAFGGWATAVAGNVSPLRQRFAADFFAYASGTARSSIEVIPNATGPIESFNGQDPFRRTHFDIERWVSQGYPRAGTETYGETVISSLSSKNLAIDIRFPESDRIMGALDSKIFAYLQRVRNNETAAEDRAAERLAVADDIANEWTSIIAAFDSENPAQPILEQYQKSLGYKVSPPIDYNYLTNIRPVGFTFVAVAMAASLGCIIWTQRHRKDRVVVASQPFFLRLICVGCLVMVSAIIPLSYDDSIASPEGCSKACMAFPWLLSIGFTVVFSSLFSKTWRLNKVFRNARNMRRIVVKEKDVILPMAILMTINCVLLLAWTLVDPLVWYRTEPVDFQSYGYCRAEGRAFIAFLVLIGIVNASVLVLANYEAWQARTITTEFSESTYIMIIQISLLQALIIGVPLLVIVHDNNAASYFVWSGMIFVLTMAILMLMFIPKMIRKAERETESSKSKTPSRYSSDHARASDAEVQNVADGLGDESQTPSRVVIDQSDPPGSPGNRTVAIGNF